MKLVTSNLSCILACEELGTYETSDEAVLAEHLRHVNTALRLYAVVIQV